MNRTVINRLYSKAALALWLTALVLLITPASARSETVWETHLGALDAETKAAVESSAPARESSDETHRDTEQTAAATDSPQKWSLRPYAQTVQIVDNHTDVVGLHLEMRL